MSPVLQALVALQSLDTASDAARKRLFEAAVVLLLQTALRTLIELEIGPKDLYQRLCLKSIGIT